MNSGLPAPRFGPLIPFALLAFSLLAPAVRADTVHLRQGGDVEGQILEQTSENVRVRTLVGVMNVPTDSIDHIDKGATVFDEYDTRRAKAGETAAEQVDLARWCDSKGLKLERRAHYQHAIELDPSCEPARTALGFIKINGLWVDGRAADKSGEAKKTARQAAPKPEPASNDEKLIAAMQSQWLQRIRTWRDIMNDNAGDKTADDARRKILELSEPIAINPLARVLSEGGLASRELLVEALGRFPQDEATLNLSVMALADPSENIRTLALSKLVQRDDPRVVPQFRKALQSDNDELIRRASRALGTLKAKSAIPELIELLTARRVKNVQVSLKPAVYFNQIAQTFDNQYVVHVGNANVIYTPAVAVVASGPGSGLEPQIEQREVVVFRTEVLEALKRITEVNFGFDDAAWRRWYEEHRS